MKGYCNKHGFTKEIPWLSTLDTYTYTYTITITITITIIEKLLLLLLLQKNYYYYYRKITITITIIEKFNSAEVYDNGQSGSTTSVTKSSLMFYYQLEANNKYICRLAESLKN